MSEKEADQLIKRYLNGKATAQEKSLVERWYEAYSMERKLPDTADFEHLKAELFVKILLRSNLHPRFPLGRIWPKIAIAASITIAVGFAIFHYQNNEPSRQTAVMHSKTSVKDVPPGSNKAILTLANGQQMLLSESALGQIATDHNVNINKRDNGQIAYERIRGQNINVGYNTITTPKGGQYQVALSDGSKIYLNAGSSITYPTTFVGSERSVTLQGEAYFEVAHDPAKPFKVLSNGQTIQVLGTHFNVKSYQEEGIIKTTLLQGSVKVIAGGQFAKLIPGQQSQVEAATNMSTIKIAQVDVDEVVAWKNGLFVFNDSSLKEVMQNIARWYDLDIDFAQTTSEVRITGSISNNVNLSSIVKLLQFEGAKLSVKGTHVQVLN